MPNLSPPYRYIVTKQYLINDFCRLPPIVSKKMTTYELLRIYQGLLMSLGPRKLFPKLNKDQSEAKEPWRLRPPFLLQM